MKKRRVFIIGILLTLWLNASVFAENWPHWRGPNFNGTSNEKNLPVKFSKTQNVRWVAKLPGMSAATPIIWQDRVFVSSLNETNDGLMAICLDRLTGKILWKKQVGIGPAKDNKSNMAAPSPVTDGKVVAFFYSTGHLAAFNFDGKELWHRNITDDYGQFAFGWTFSSSLTMYGGKLYLPVMQRDVPVRGRGRPGRNGTIESFLLCMDPQTGKTIYRQVRPSLAKMESREAFTTIIPFVYNDREELLLAGGDCLTGHDPKTGKELWRWGTWNKRREQFWRLVPSPVAGAGLVWACAPKGSPIYAIKAGAVGDVSRNGLAWQSSDKTISTDVCTPAFYEGNLFVLNGEKKYISSINPTSGKIIWQTELGGRIIYRSSPTIADGKIYCMNHRAEITVLDAKTGDILSQSKMGEPDADKIRSSIAVAQGNLFIRTNYHLYCVGNNSESKQTQDTSAAQAAPFSVEVTGQGRPMILIPGLSCGGNVWDATVAHFKDRYECHVFTLAGFAGQPAIEGTSYLPTIRDAIVSYIKDQKLDRPVIVGHSLGGTLAYWVGATAPELAGPIVAVDGVPFMSALWNPEATSESVGVWARQMREEMGSQSQKTFTEQNRSFLENQITRRDDMERVASYSGKSDPMVVAQAMYELMTTDLREEVKAIRTPVMLIAPTGQIKNPDRRSATEASYRDQVALIPEHQIIFASKGKHFVQLDEPQWFYDQVERFLAETEKSGK